MSTLSSPDPPSANWSQTAFARWRTRVGANSRMLRSATWRTACHCVSLLLLLALFAGMVVQPAHAAADESRVLPQLQIEAAAHPNQKFRVIVTRLGETRAADAALQAAGGSKLQDLFTNAFAAELPGRAVAGLGRNAAVKFISYDAALIRTGSVDGSKLGTVYPGAIKASGLWSSLTGAGIGVAVVDSGINPGLPDWKGVNGVSRITARQKFGTAPETEADAFGHGSHVAGIIAGNSWYRSDSAVKGKYIGIAPEANLIDVKVADSLGMSYTSDVVNAIEWVIANRQAYNIRVLNLSLISSVAESARTSVLDAAVERAWFNGIFVVAAAGNLGPDSMYFPPANDPFVMTVGAADPKGTVSVGDDDVAFWSSYGITQDGFSKPDVVAPGRYIVAPLASATSTFAKLHPNRIVDGNYIRMSGTSMAAPMVAGMAALAFQAKPQWTNDQVKWLIMRTATKLGTTVGTTFTALPGQGGGEVDAKAAAEFVGNGGTLQLANQGLTINELLVGPNGATVYTNGALADSTTNWSTTNWSTTNWSTTNWSTTNWSTSNWSTTTARDVE